MSCPAVTEAFINLDGMPVRVTDTVLAEIVIFVVVLYSRTYPLSKVNDARKQLISQNSRSMENIPPTQDALLQHTKRATYQGGYCWSQTLRALPQLPSPGDWG